MIMLGPLEMKFLYLIKKHSVRQTNKCNYNQDWTKGQNIIVIIIMWTMTDAFGRTTCIMPTAPGTVGGIRLQ